MLDSGQIQERNILYETNEELLKDILKNNKFKHSKHLQHLAENHLGHLLKLRFTLSPFSFIFLLQGSEQFHIILETLDTEEATYLWHFNKEIQLLPHQLKVIDQQLTIIKNQGRQAFIETNPENFSRIVHDYSNNLKGFIIWKGMLEERLI